MMRQKKNGTGACYFMALEKNILLTEAPEIKKLQSYFSSFMGNDEVIKKLPKNSVSIDKSEILKEGMEIVKLLAIKMTFEMDFISERNKILQQEMRRTSFIRTDKIEYLIARAEDSVVGFMICQSNYKTAKVYLRWVTVDPNFHRIGLGKLMIDTIEKNFPEARGLELYTRTANNSAREFYKKIGFIETSAISSKPIFQKENKYFICPPDDDLPDENHKDAYRGCTRKSLYKKY